MELRIGDTVMMKLGMRDPDLDIDIGGWEGRIEEVDDGGTVLIRWDSILRWAEWAWNLPSSARIRILTGN